MSISIMSLFISFLLIWCRCKDLGRIFTPLIFSLLLYAFSFYLVKLDMNNIGKDNLLNPFSLLVLSGSIPLGLFVGSFAKRQIKLVIRGLTTKQYESISKEIVLDGNKKLADQFELNKKLSFKEMMMNIYKFLTKKQCDSIISNSDL